MYTGTLIGDLMSTVERAEQSARQKQMVDERELHWLYEFQGSQERNERVFVGAA